MSIAEKNYPTPFDHFKIQGYFSQSGNLINDERIVVDSHAEIHFTSEVKIPAVFFPSINGVLPIIINQ